MSKINNAIHEIHYIDNIASRDQWVNNLHPLVKFVLTVVYIVTVVSFSKYDIIGLLGMVIYIIAGFMLAEVSFKDALWRLRVILPIVCIVGIANPFFDKVPIVIGSLTIRAGVISMITLMIKGIFTVLASYLLIATTTIEKFCYALRLIHVPKIIVTQIMLTYRYITLLLDEVNRTTQAYALRAPKQKGVHYKVWGSLTGHLLLRSIDRANEVFESMTLRGFNGEFSYIRDTIKIGKGDIIYLMVWLGIIILFKMYPIILVVGNMF